MKNIRRFLKIFQYTLGILVFLSLYSCSQENLLFYPDKLPADYKFQFSETYEELNIPVDHETTINGLLFKAEKSKGLIFFLHGNAGALNSWGNVARLYLKSNYDCFILDYRGFGKSGGEIESEKQLHNDVQIAYDSLKKHYKEEEDIVVIGYSLGTGLAAQLAMNNNPKHLVLCAPYYSMVDLAKHHYSIIPSFMVRYKLKTNEYIESIKCPISIFHGKEDQLIPVNSAERLAKLFKDKDELILLEKTGHNGINGNATYENRIRKLLRN